MAMSAEHGSKFGSLHRYGDVSISILLKEETDFIEPQLIQSRKYLLYDVKVYCKKKRDHFQPFPNSSNCHTKQIAMPHGLLSSEWKILEWDDKPHINRKKNQNQIWIKITKHSVLDTCHTPNYHYWNWFPRRLQYNPWHSLNLLRHSLSTPRYIP